MYLLVFYGSSSPPRHLDTQVPENTKGRDLVVSIQYQALSAKLKAGEELVSLKLAEPIHPDDSTWTVGSDGLVISMEKASPSTWHSLGA